MENWGEGIWRDNHYSLIEPTLGVRQIQIIHHKSSLSSHIYLPAYFSGKDHWLCGFLTLLSLAYFLPNSSHAFSFLSFIYLFIYLYPILIGNTIISL